ncbi:MAG TPA: hypothetical protein VKS78_17420 [Roseiarcus sp.]|nr:hypothetical protein [Roseiarcus sp.]
MPDVDSLAIVGLVIQSIGVVMHHTLRALVIAALAFSLGACAPPPPPPSADIAPPAKKRLDAKTQLETGKTY